MKRTSILAAGAVAAALVLAGGAATVATAVSLPADATQVLDDGGVDTSTLSPSPSSSPSPSPTGSARPEPGDDNGQDGVVTVPPADPTVTDRHGDPDAPDDHPGAHDRNGHDGDSGDRIGEDGGHHDGTHHDDGIDGGHR